MKERIEGWLGGTYRIFQQPKGLFKLFQQFKPTDEAYVNAINLFRRYLAKTDKTRKKILIQMVQNIMNKQSMQSMIL